MDDLNQTIPQPFKVICISDEGLDDRIEDSERVVKGNEYIVTNVFSDLIGGEDAFKLLDKDPHPFRGYGNKRFAPHKGEYIPSLISIN